MFICCIYIAAVPTITISCPRKYKSGAQKQKELKQKPTVPTNNKTHFKDGFTVVDKQLNKSNDEEIEVQVHDNSNTYDSRDSQNDRFDSVGSGLSRDDHDVTDEDDNHTAMMNKGYTTFTRSDERKCFCT